MEGLVIAERQRLGDRILSTFHDHVAHTILQLRQQRALHNFSLVSFACCDMRLIRGVLSVCHVRNAAAVHHTAFFTNTSAIVCPSALTGHVAWSACLLLVLHHRPPQPLCQPGRMPERILTPSSMLAVHAHLTN